MPLRLNKFTPIFQTIREIPGIARRPRSMRVQQSGHGLIYYMIKRQKPEQNFVYRNLYAESLGFHFLA